MACVESTQTTLNWYPKTYRAELNIDVSDLKRLVGTQSKAPEDLLLERYFGGPMDNEWSVAVKLVTGLSVKVVFVRRLVSNGAATVTFGSISNPGPLSRIVVEEGHCLVCFTNADTQDAKPIKTPCKPGVIGFGETVCELTPFKLPEGNCKISFSVTYSKSIVQSEVESKPARSLDSSKFRAAFKNLFISEKETDFQFVFDDGEVIKAHKAVLVALAPFFEKMMASRMAETQTNSVKIEDADSKSFRCLILFVYCGELPEDLDAIATEVLPLADKYLLEDLKQACVHSIEKSLAPENICKSLILSHRQECAALKTKCIRRLKSWKANLTSSMLTELQAYPELLAEVVLSSA